VGKREKGMGGPCEVAAVKTGPGGVTYGVPMFICHELHAKGNFSLALAGPQEEAISGDHGGGSPGPLD